MNFNHIHYFVTLVDFGNMTKAAEALFITQPTLSLALKKMNTELASPAFYYEHNTLKLTKTGELLYQRGKELVDIYNDLLNDIQNLNLVPTKDQLIRIGLTSLSREHYLQLLQPILKKHTNVKLHFIEEGSRKLQSLINEGNIDFGIVSTPIIYSNISYRPMNIETPDSYRLAVAMSTNHHLANKHSIELSELKNQNFCCLDDSYILNEDYIFELTKKAHFSPNIQFKDNRYDVLLQMIKQYNMIGILPDILEKNFADNNLKFIPLNIENNHFPLVLAINKQKQHTPLIKEFFNLLKTD